MSQQKLAMQSLNFARRSLASVARTHPQSHQSHHGHLCDRSISKKPMASSSPQFSRISQRCFSAAAEAAEPSTSSTVSSEQNAQTAPSRPRNAYLWGTSKKGTIPLNLIGETSASGGIFSGEEKVVDHPRLLDWNGLAELLSSTSSTSGEDGEDGDTSGDGSDNSVALEKIVCGATGTAIILKDGRCFVMGTNKNGELGIGNLKESPTPTPLELPTDPQTLSLTHDPHPRIAHASLGPNFSALLTTSGDLYTFGFGGSRLNGLGCLGHGNTTSYNEPKLVTSLIEDGCLATDVHCGEYSLTVLTEEGEVLCCGSGSYGRLGNLETVDQLYLEPVEMMGEGDVKEIAGGLGFSLALTKDGVVYGWGSNNEGQLGTGMGLSVDMYAMEAVPTPIERELEGRTVTRIAAGNTHAACVTSNGELFTWGMNMSHLPVLQTTLLHTKIVDVACGNKYTVALDENGRIYTMGKGKSGVLGLASTTTDTAYPILVEGIPENERVVSMSCGWSHVACITEGNDE